MIYVIQKLENGEWVDARHSNGSKIFFSTKRAAEKFVRGLADYRFIKIVD